MNTIERVNSLNGTQHAMNYYASFGPTHGPIPFQEKLPIIGVFAWSGRRSRAVYPVGTAHPVAWVAYKGTTAATYRLVIENQELEGRWVCDGRRFVRIATFVEQ